MNTTKKLAFAAIGSLSLVTSQAFAQIKTGDDKIQAGLKGSNNTADVAGQNFITNAMLLLGILAVAYGLYGGFLMLTAGGDDGKVKKGRTILVQVAIGLVVIFLANSIFRLILNLLTNI